MKEKKIGCISFLIVILSFIGAGYANAQIAPDSAIESIANIERKSFANRFVNGRVAGEQAYQGSVASSNFDVNFYRCEWQVDPNIKFIKGKVTSYFTITTPTDKIVYDLSDTLTVDSITFRGNQISFQKIANDGLQLQFPAVLNSGRKDSVSIYYNGVPRNYASFRPFVQTVTPAIYGGNPIVYTLSEPFGAKEWWPCKNGLNDKADSIDIIVTNPAVYQASSNGVMVQEAIINGNKISTWKHRYPIASYLVAFAVSKYAVLKDTVMIGNNIMELVDYAYPDAAVINFFTNQRSYTKYTLALYGRLFGDYPFAKEKYGYTNYEGGGGMEHQTNSFVIGPTIQLVSHETGHQWFGDKITCGSWHDIWLNEGFATYCEILYKESLDKNTVYPALRQYINNITAVSNGSVWVDDTTSAARIFSSRLSYQKGAYLLHMLRWKLGDDVFFKAVRRYLNDPSLKYGFAKTADLQRNLEQESGTLLSSFFNEWFYGQGYPTYDLEWKQDSSNNLLVKINQITSDPSVSFFSMPVPVQFKANGKDTIIAFNNTKNSQTFLANPGFRADTAIFDPNLWILSRSVTKHADCSADENSATILPFYDIQWFQNANNWVYLTASQVNHTASDDSEKIPLYLHFKGNGRDTSFEIKNINYIFNTWLNIGFKATTVSITTSCLLKNRYTIENKTDNTSVNNIKIYPVPAVRDITVSIKNPTDKQIDIRLYSSTGQLLYRRQANTTGRDELFLIPISHLARGVYIIKLKSESSIKLSQKIIK